ncbi:MAG: hypothetical protein K9M11_03145 [Candidatus Pacebacteria bacterium]|nr:hypothetical protein [Candidatus Paceibacterota bacterium]
MKRHNIKASKNIRIPRTHVQKEKLDEFMLRIVTKAIKIAQKEAAHFSRIVKLHYNGVDADLVTSGDLKVQKYHVNEILKWNPNVGLIGEEKALMLKPKKGFALGDYFTDDPIDGTRAFGRRQSTGVGTMLAHVNKGKVDAVCIGDVNTGEIYQFAQGLPPTRTRFGVKSLLQPDTKTPLGEMYVLLTNPPDDYPAVLRKMVRKKKGGVFKDMEVTSGSIGITVARLWKGEIGMLVIRPNGFDTPWDNTPIIGMNKALGIKHLKLNPQTLEIHEFNPQLPLKVVQKDYIEILAHESRVKEIVQWIERHR